MSDADITARLKLNAQQFSSELNRELGSVETRVDRAANRINAAFGKLKLFAGGLGVALGAREMTQLADEYATITARLRLATAESGSFSRAQGDVRRIAAETRTSLSATAELYASMARNGQELGITQEQIARATETVNKAIRVSGGSAASAAAGVTQLGQALASGVLRGDEFNSMMENSPRLAKLLAESLGVPIGQLRAMAQEGELTADKLVKALTDKKYTAGLDAEFKQLPVTFSEATTRIYNAALTVFGEFDQGGQFSASIANFATEGADSFETLVSDAEKMGRDFRAIFDGLGNAFEPFEAGARAAFNGVEDALDPLARKIEGLLGLLDSVYNFGLGASRSLDVAADLLTFGLVGEEKSAAFGKGKSDMAGSFRRGYLQSQAESGWRKSQQFTTDLNEQFSPALLHDVMALFGLDRPLPKARAAGSDKLDEQAAKAAARAAEAAAKERQRLEESYNTQREANAAELHFLDLKMKGLDEQEELERAIFDLRRQNADLVKIANGEDQKAAAVARERLATLEAETAQIVKANQALEAKTEADAAAARAAEDALEEQRRNAEEMYRDLGDLYYDIFTSQGGSIWDQFKRRGLSVLADLAAQWTLSFLSGNVSGPSPLGGGGFLGSLFGGGGMPGLPDYTTPGGGIGGGLPGAIGSLGQSVFGKGFGYDPAAMRLAEAGGMDASAAIGGSALGQLGAGLAISAIGSKVPGLLGIKGSTTGGMIGGGVGLVAGGLVGAAIGSVLGSVLGGALKKTKKGSATIGYADGGLGVTSLTGNSASRKQGASDAANSIIGSIEDIAAQLGGEIIGPVSTSIGIRKKSYRVDTTGQGRTKGAGVLDFGQDGQAAAEAAIRDMISDSVIGGISAASQRILASGKDLQKSIEQASLIESIPKRLKAIDDPLGAATDDLVAEFRKIKQALDEGGATAQQYADAEKLFNREREALVERIGSNAQTLKDFQASLTVGGNSPLSLRDQEAAARAALDPFVSAIGAGKTIDQDKFTEAAQQYLDVSRGLNGSTDAFFREYERIQQLLGAAISTAESNQSKNFENPFAEATANAAQATAAGINTMVGQMSQLLKYFQSMGGTRLGFVK